jgi:hypothetical protein
VQKLRLLTALPLLSRDAMEDRGLWPYPQIDAVATASIVVDQRGYRILDEGLGGISITNDLARLDDPLCATVICDAPIWETAGKAAQISPNPQLLAAGGTLHRADTIEALAETDANIMWVAALNFALAMSVLSWPRPDAPPPVLLAPT